MKRLFAVFVTTFLSWLLSTLIYLVLTLPLEWSEWRSFTIAANKIVSAAFGHGIYAVLIFAVGLFVSFRSLGVRLALAAVCIALCVAILGVTGGDNLLDWLRAFAHWIAAASMPFIFYAVHSRYLRIALEVAAH